MEHLYIGGFAALTDLSRRGCLANMVHVMTKKSNSVVVWLLAILILSPAMTGAEVAVDDVERQARELFTTIMSPYCPGSLLNQCPSSQAAVLRDDIRQRLRDGASPEQIQTELIATYGEGILASPPFSGVGVLSWLGAVAIFLGGLGAVGIWLRGRRPTQEPPATKTAADDDLHKRMREEIASDDEI